MAVCPTCNGTGEVDSNTGPGEPVTPPKKKTGPWVGLNSYCVCDEFDFTHTMSLHNLPDDTFVERFEIE